MNIKPILRQHLDSYANLLVRQIKNSGYAGEFISDEHISPLNETRLLCQSRGIFFLLDYAVITNNDDYIELAIKLHETIQSNYYSPTTQSWTQLPLSVVEQNISKDKMLYEYAFVITAFAKLYAVTNDEALLTSIDQVRLIIAKDFYNPHAKFSYLIDKQKGVNQNALMHLLEAYIELNSVTENLLYRHELQALAEDLIPLIYDTNAQLIREYSGQAVFEPGHSFEWASLILEAQSKGFLPLTILNHQELATSAERQGISANNMVLAELTSDKSASEVYRIWPLLERIRYYAMTNDSKLSLALESLVKVFFSTQNLPYEYVNQGLVPMQERVKATTGYHIINCYKYILG